MNCQSFENIIDDLARDQLIEATLRQEALQHANECLTCAVRMKAEQSLTESLRAMAREMNLTGAPERVESFLLASFSEQRLSHNKARARRWSPLNIAAAAVVLVALGISFAILRSQRPPTERAKNFTSPVAVASDQTTLETSEAPSKSKENAGAIPKRKVRRGSSTRATLKSAADAGNTAQLAAGEVTTDFMPIGYVNSASLQDGGSVVRVELPRSTIVSMGFALNMDRSGERVKADVLMGADGLARAIRFVQ